MMIGLCGWTPLYFSHEVIFF